MKATPLQQAVASSIVLAGAGFESIAGATSYDPTSALTGMSTSVTSYAAPILIIIVASLIPLLVVFMIIEWVKKLFKGHQRNRRQAQRDSLSAAVLTTIDTKERTGHYSNGEAARAFEERMGMQ